MYAVDADPMNDLLEARSAKNKALEKDRIAAEENQNAKRPATELEVKKAYVKRSTEIADTAEHEFQRLLEEEKRERVKKRWSEFKMYFGNEVKVNIQENKAPVNELLWERIKSSNFKFAQKMAVYEHSWISDENRGHIVDLHDTGKPYLYVDSGRRSDADTTILIYDIQRGEGTKKVLVAVPILYDGNLVDGGILALIESLQKMQGSKKYKAQLFRDIIRSLKLKEGNLFSALSKIRSPDNYANYHQDYMQLLAFYEYLRTDDGVSQDDALDTVFGTLEDTPYAAQFKRAWDDAPEFKELVNGSEFEEEIAAYFENLEVPEYVEPVTHTRLY